MTTLSSRRIFKSTVASQSELRELLEFLFSGELLGPSSRIWMVTPWISDITILDNRSGCYDTLVPEWGRRQLRLSDVLVRLMLSGTEIVVVTRPDPHNTNLVQKVTDLAHDWFVGDRFRVIHRENLHTKGILTDQFLIAGSMNITNNGLELLEEMITFDTAPEDVGQARISFESYLEAKG
jgi:hypothetical protein